MAWWNYGFRWAKHWLVVRRSLLTGQALSHGLTPDWLNCMAEVLLTHSNNVYSDRKQVEKMQPYPPLQTILAASVLRQAGIETALFDPTLDSPGRSLMEAFELALDRHRPRLVVVCEDDFNFLSKMCLIRNRELAFHMAEAARRRGIPIAVHGSDASDRVRGLCGRGVFFRADWRGGIDTAGTGGGPAVEDHSRSCVCRREFHPLHSAARSNSRPRCSPVAGVGSCRHRTIPADMDVGTRLFRTRYGIEPRVSVPMQLVREADLRPEVSFPLGAIGGCRDAASENCVRSGPDLVRGRHLRAVPPVDR